MPISTLPAWATGAAADRIEPPAAKKALGWVAGEPASASTFNWLLYQGYLALVYLDARSTGYATIEALIAATAAGETAELMENDSAALPGSSLASFTAGAVTVDLACDGTYVYIANAATVRRYTRTGGVAGVTYTPTISVDPIVRVVTNGTYVVIVAGVEVECFTASTGVSLWSVSYGGIVQDVAIDATSCYICGVGATGRGMAAASALATGASSWIYDHSAVGAALHSIATDGRSVFVAGAPSSYASLASLRALNASNGRAATAEGAGLADTNGLAWDAVTTTAITGRGCIAVDGDRVYLGFQSTVRIESRSKLTGSILMFVTPPGGIVVRRLAVDQDLLYAASDAAAAVVLALATVDLSTVWRFAAVSPLVATDGAAAFVGRATTTAVTRVARGNRPNRWLRIDPATALGAPFRWLAIPAR